MLGLHMLSSKLHQELETSLLIGFLNIFVSHWFQNILVIWQHLIEGGREFITMRMIRGRRKGYLCYQNYDLSKGWIHSGVLIREFTVTF